jgi:hypothetical protein
MWVEFGEIAVEVSGLAVGACPRIAAHYRSSIPRSASVEFQPVMIRQRAWSAVGSITSVIVGPPPVGPINTAMRRAPSSSSGSDARRRYAVQSRRRSSMRQGRDPSSAEGGPSREELMRLLRRMRSALRVDRILILQTPNGQGLFPGRVICRDLTHLTIFDPSLLEGTPSTWSDVMICVSSQVALG